MNELLTITVLRKKLGISQTELASAIGVSQPDVSMWENGTFKLPATRAEQIFKVLASHPESRRLPNGITPEDLSRPWDRVLLGLTPGSSLA